MRGTLIKIGEDNTGTHFGLNLGGTIYPLSDREADIRRVGEGSKVSFTVAKEGEVILSVPNPVIGCERKV